MRTISDCIRIVKNKSIRNLIDIAYAKLMYSRYPNTINVEIMNKCNLKCKHCRVTYYGNIIKDVKPDFMDFNCFIKIVDRISPLIKRARAFQFSTVEPLFHIDIFKMMDYVSAYNKTIEYPLLSNGMLLTEKNISELLKRNVPSVTISLDGLKKEKVEAFKTNTNYDRVVSNIRLLTALCKNKIEVHVVFVATTLNINELVEYVDFVNDLGVDRILVNGFMSFLPEFSHLYLYTKQGNKEVQNVFQLANVNARRKKLYIEFPSLTAKPSGCNLHSNMNIDEKGNISPCILLARETPFTLFSKTATVQPVIWGNVFADDPLSIWKGEKSVRFRSMLKNKAVPNECFLCADAYGVICSNRVVSPIVVR